VAVPTVLAVAENVADLPWEHLAVVLDAREGEVYAAPLARAAAGEAGPVAPAGEPAVCPAGEFLASAPRPILLVGEGLLYHELSGEGVSIAEPSRHLPRPEGVWRVGRRMARAGRYVDLQHLLPIYARKPKVLRDWEARGTAP